MEYVEGPTLQQALAGLPSPSTLPMAEVVRLAAEIDAALDAAHAQGVIHRDVKPAIILLDRQRGRGVLTDFGLALLATLGTRGDALGSPHYLAPEQALASSGAVPQSDLYALAVILYEMVAGQVPFDAESPIAVALMHLKEPAPPARSVQADVSPAVEAVLARALAKRPEERYPSGAALVDAAPAGALVGGAARGAQAGSGSGPPSGNGLSNGGRQPAALATWLGAASAAPGEPQDRDTLPSRPAVWDWAMRLGSGAARAARFAPADALLLVLLIIALVGGLLWQSALASTDLSAAGFAPVAMAAATARPTQSGSSDSPASRPTRAAMGAAAGERGQPTPGAATAWWQTPPATRVFVVVVPPTPTNTLAPRAEQVRVGQADTAAPSVVVEGGGGSPPAEPTPVPPADTAPPPPTQAPPAIPTVSVPLPTDTTVPLPTQTLPIPSTDTAVPAPTDTALPPPTHTAEPTVVPDVNLCHRPPGNPRNAHTTTVSAEELPSHLAHGDTLGPCP